MNIIKNSSVALTIGLLELTGARARDAGIHFKVFEAFTAATVIYLITNIVVVLADARAREQACACRGSSPRRRVPQAGTDMRSAGH